jgi:nucleoid-associated protein YgaU
MRIKEMSKILSLGVLILFLGCSDKDNNKQKVAQSTKEALGSSGESGCDSKDAKKNKECSEERSSSNFILETLVKDSNVNINTTAKQDDSLRGKLNSLLEDMSNEEKQGENSAKKDLEQLVNQIEEIAQKDTTQVVQGIENLVDSYDKEKNSESIKDELANLVNSVESSNLKREEVESELLALVGDVESKKLKREEVKEKLLELVGDASKNNKQNLKQTQLSLEKLVTSAEKRGTKEAKRLASSIIEDVAKNRIKIIRTDDVSVVIQVQSGDSLSLLAQKYYGDAAKYKLIYEANRGKIGNKHTIYPGTTLVIPKLETTN